MEDKNKKLPKIHVVVTDTETGKVIVDETQKTVLLAMSNYDDIDSEGELRIVRYANGSNNGIAECLTQGKGLSLARLAVAIAQIRKEQEDDD